MQQKHDENLTTLIKEQLHMNSYSIKANVVFQRNKYNVVVKYTIKPITTQIRND